MCERPSEEVGETVNIAALRSITRSTRTRYAARAPSAPERGYAVTLEEPEIGLRAVAAPIRSRDGKVVADLRRLRTRVPLLLVPALLQGAQEVSHRMGYLG